MNDLLATFCLRNHCQLVPVRYRPNAASGGWSMGVALCTAVKREHTRFDIISLNIHKATSRWHLPGCCTLTSTADFCCLARHPTNCSTAALPKVFSSDLPVCQCIRTHMLVQNLAGVHVGCINYGLLWYMCT